MDERPLLKVDKAHQAAKSKEVYSSIKKITRKTSIKMQTVKSKDGHILTEMNDVKHRWKVNYEELYNHRNPVNEDFVSQLPQMPSMEPEPQILREEVASAVKKLTDEKVPRFDCIMGEELKAPGETGIDILHKLCLKIWTEEIFPDDWGRAIITPILRKRTSWTVETTKVLVC